ncbi:MAG: tetratricopeptide repeat protein, partial [Chitinophagales bacterium]
YLTAYNNFNTYMQSEKEDIDALREAYIDINEAAQHENTRENGKTWYYRGLINQALSENEKTQLDYPNALYDATDSYIKALTLDDRRFRDEKGADVQLRTMSIILYNKGVALYEVNDFEKAYKAFIKVEDIYNYYKEKGEPEAIETYENSIFNAALCAVQSNKTDEAIKLLNKLIEMEYNNAGIYSTLATVYKSQGDMEAAKATLAKGTERYPENVGLIIDELNIMLAEGKEGESIEKLQKAIKLDPENVSLYLVLGTAYDKIGDSEKAKETYEKAIEVNPNSYEAYNNLAAYYINKGAEVHEELNKKMNELSDAKYKEMTKQVDDLYSEALPYLEKAHKIQPDDMKIMDSLKKIYAKLGMYNTEEYKVLKKKMDAAK